MALPWRNDLAPEYRVWILWYDKVLERRIRGRLAEFEFVTKRHGHGWRALDLAPTFAPWIARHELFAGLVEMPDEFPGVRPDFKRHMAELLRTELGHTGPDDVLAVTGAGAMFGLTSVASLIESVAGDIRGRLLLCFPGRHENGVYRLLDARDGWNYRALPIPPADAV